jgi:molybdopterin synthase catalytic subunit
LSYLSEAPLDLPALEAGVRAAGIGGTVVFTGTVRDQNAGRPVLRLEYSAYGPMAEQECGRIVDAARRRWPVQVALAHRVGLLEIGEPAIVVVVAAPHRGEAFEACRWIVDEVKARVPIWKREHYTDGSTDWVASDAGVAP